ncbi:hypothetical protein G6F37_003564 [Rhizopus arrhizus]|nr:hypothetical protein G6F38_000810 [Rhizopus arrhizus]KAG1160897.1 hypothetical protein G6F37_003564 [Rhizopus arrhizus]
MKSSLTAPLTASDLLEAVHCCPAQSSSGSDSIPYALLSVILCLPDCKAVALQVFNDALSLDIFPPSWSDTCVSLLSKKGNLSDLRNWRPISLISTDAKVYTRLLDACLLPAVSSLITPFQTRFMRRRFIADNGLLMKLIKNHCTTNSSATVGLLLDQEKAYDWVHPDYLRQVLSRIGIPDSFITSVCSLFFSTRLGVNINGFLSSPVPHCVVYVKAILSPVLFNLAFEPFLRSSIHDFSIHDVSLPLPIPSPVILPPDMSLIKLLAYVDDVVCLLDSPSDLHRLLRYFETYSQASNTSLNYSKTQVLSLSGSNNIYDEIWRTPLRSYSLTALIIFPRSCYDY